TGIEAAAAYAEVAPRRDGDERLVGGFILLANRRFRVVEDVGVEREIFKADILDAAALRGKEPLPVPIVISDLQDGLLARTGEAPIALVSDGLRPGGRDNVGAGWDHQCAATRGHRVDCGLDSGGIVRPAVSCRAVLPDIVRPCRRRCGA